MCLDQRRGFEVSSWSEGKPFSATTVLSREYSVLLVFVGATRINIIPSNESISENVMVLFETVLYASYRLRRRQRFHPPSSDKEAESLSVDLAHQNQSPPLPNGSGRVLQLQALHDHVLRRGLKNTIKFQPYISDSTSCLRSHELDTLAATQLCHVENRPFLFFVYRGFTGAAHLTRSGGRALLVATCY